MNRLATSSEIANEMFSELGFIMKHVSSGEVATAMDGFFKKIANEKFLLIFAASSYIPPIWAKGNCQEIAQQMFSYEDQLYSELLVLIDLIGCSPGEDQPDEVACLNGLIR